MSDAGDRFGGDGVEPVEPSGQPLSPSRASRRRKPRWRRIALVLAVPAFILLAALALWYELNAHALGPEGKQVILDVGNGESISGVVTDLSNKHVIASTLAFRLSDLIHGDPAVSPGFYALHVNQTYGQVRAILSSGPNVSAVNVRAGYSLHEVAERVDVVNRNESFAKVAASGVVHSIFSPTGSSNLEGMLGSGIYLIPPGEDDTELLTKMVTRFDQQATTAGLNQASATTLGLTPYQIIAAASVVEKEGYILKNMPDVARVIYNRLAHSMPLQMDSTVLYALGQDGGPVTPQDEQIQSPYNSYLNKGLPPTPICVPSTNALSAALHPPVGGWLYFVVVKKDGTEAFADTFAEQQANEQLARSNGVG
jgi:UPF0755 protein